jgi:hypothetical protein
MGQRMTVSSLLQARLPLSVIAAATGRQDSIRLGALEGGFDTNRNGTIELAELYGALKRQVLGVTHGQQTPWIARDQMVGKYLYFNWCVLLRGSRLDRSTILEELRRQRGPRPRLPYCS